MNPSLCLPTSPTQYNRQYKLELQVYIQLDLTNINQYKTEQGIHNCCQRHRMRAYLILILGSSICRCLDHSIHFPSIAPSQQRRTKHWKMTVLRCKHMHIHIHVPMQSGKFLSCWKWWLPASHWSLAEVHPTMLHLFLLQYMYYKYWNAPSWIWTTLKPENSNAYFKYATYMCIINEFVSFL